MIKCHPPPPQPSAFWVWNIQFAARGWKIAGVSANVCQLDLCARPLIFLMSHQQCALPLFFSCVVRAGYQSWPKSVWLSADLSRGERERETHRSFSLSAFHSFSRKLFILLFCEGKTYFTSRLCHQNMCEWGAKININVYHNPNFHFKNCAV